MSESLEKPIRTGRGANKGRPSRQRETRQDNNVTGYPSGHILSKQNTCLDDKRGSQHVSQIEASARSWDCADMGESIADFIVPRKSITRAQHLALFPATSTEVMDLRIKVAEKDEKGKIVLDPKRFVSIYIVTTPTKEIHYFTNERNAIAFRDMNGGVLSTEKQHCPNMISASNPRTITKTDKTLLNRGNPFRSIEDDSSLKRMEHRSKRKVTDKSTYKNYLGEVDDRKPDATPTLTLDADDPIFRE